MVHELDETNSTVADVFKTARIASPDELKSFLTKNELDEVVQACMDEHLTELHRVDAVDSSKLKDYFNHIINDVTVLDKVAELFPNKHKDLIPLRIKLFDRQYQESLTSRQGTSAYRLGLVQQAISDHLPIKAMAAVGGQQVDFLSWNLLADDHLYNNFRNISGSVQIFNAVKDLQIYGGTESNNRLYYFFSEIAEFLYEKADDGTITITPQLLDEFLKTTHSRLERADGGGTALENAAKVIADREKLVTMLLDSNLEIAHECDLALQHSIELIHHIKNGSLKWENRVKLLKNNTKLIDEIRQASVICLQECTNPVEVQQIISSPSADYKCHSYRVSQRTNDNVTILFDSSRYEVLGVPHTHNIDNKKPSLFLKLKDKNTDDKFIVGTIHPVYCAPW